MKTGRDLKEIAAEVFRQQETKRDYVAPAKSLRLAVAEPTMGGGSPTVALGIGDLQIVGIRPTAHEQIAEHAGVPQRYYQRMLAEAPGLLAQNVNTWWGRSADKRMVRTLDGGARALLSDKFRTLDNFDLLEAVLPKLGSAGLDVVSAEITERRLYVKAIDRGIAREVKRIRDAGGHEWLDRDELHPGIVISNSEIGEGRLQVEPLLFRRLCSNLAIVNESTIRQIHVGKGSGPLDDAQQYFRDDTRRAIDQAFFMKVRDAVDYALSPAILDAAAAKAQAAAGEVLEGDPVKVVEVAQKRLGLSEEERGSVLMHLIQGGDLSKWGLSNAVTRTAEDAADYDRATELERVGWNVVDLPASAFSVK